MDVEVDLGLADFVSCLCFRAPLEYTQEKDVGRQEMGCAGGQR